MTTYRTMMLEFFETFEPPKEASFWETLVDEEFKELGEAFESNAKKEEILKELGDVLYVITGYALSKDPDSKTFVDFLFTFSEVYPEVLCRTLGIEEIPEAFLKHSMDKLFETIHRSNMTKLGDDGKPIRREDGKILKGPNYKAPDMKAFVEELKKDFSEWTQ